MKSETIMLGAVAYDPKVVGIWEGMRRYFREEAKLPVEVVLFLSYEAQVDALLESRIDIAWNTNLAFVQCEKRSAGQALPLAMRDTDLEWRSHVITLSGGTIAALADLRGKRVALGSRDSGHAAILPAYYLAQAGLVEGVDYQSKRFDTDLGKHGDTGTSEVDVIRAVMNGEVDAGTIGSPFWESLQDGKLVPRGALRSVWTSPAFHHCMFTARTGLPADTGARFVSALRAMHFDDPKHRPILEAEGLKEWVVARTDGYASLREAAAKAGLL